MRKFFAAAAFAATMAFTAAPASAADITGAGATFPFPIYAKWAEAYKAATGVGLNYQSIGSGGGIRQIRAKTVDFGATDAPVRGEELTRDAMIQFPMVMGGVVPVVNVQGIGQRGLRLTGAVLADIYLGKVTRWNDAQITALNPGVSLPNATINVVYRSDGSGTTFVWTEYLSMVAPEWQQRIGRNTSVQWPVGVGGRGNEGVAGTVRQIANSIGYVEYAYAKQNNLGYALVQNAAGRFPEPDDKSFQAAANGADWTAAPGFGISLNNQAAPEAWPIVSATFILMYAKPADPARSTAALRFFDWAFSNGDKLALDLEYVPMPAAVKAKVRQEWLKVTDAQNRPVHTPASN
jgi:phosphate transport system substrate-binding protein